MLAFRLLVHIGLRARSPSINDPATCRHMIEAVGGSLGRRTDRHLAIGDIADPEGQRRLRLLNVPTWDDYGGAAFDELTGAAHGTQRVMTRLSATLDDLRTVPTDRRSEIEGRRERVNP